MHLLKPARIISCVAAAMLAIGCGGPSPQPKADAESLVDSIPLVEEFDPDAEFRWANSDGATSWDPTMSLTSFDQAFLSPVYDRLVYAAPDGTLEPMLAESWNVSDDRTALTFHLRAGITFSDGAPLNAEAVKQNLERMLDPESPQSTYLASITAIEVVDELTVRLVGADQMGSVLTQMSGVPGMIASPQSISAGTLDTQPVGAGPYIATEIIPGNSVQFERTPNYWDPDVQRVASMFFQAIPDDQTRLNGLISGQFDGAVIRPNQVNAANRDELAVVSATSPVFSWLNLNTGIEPLDDPSVRLAINHAIDRAGISEGLWDGFCTPQTQPFPDTSFAYSKEAGDGLDEWDYDPQKAKELLADAGYEDGFTLNIVAGDVSVNTATAEIIQSQLKDVGVTVTIEVLSSVPLVQEFVVDKTAGGMIATSGSLDPHSTLQAFLLPDSRFNPGGQTPQEMTDLILEAAAPLNTEERGAIYTDLMELWMETPPNLIPICMTKNLQAFSATVTGVDTYASGVYDFRGIAIKQT